MTPRTVMIATLALAVAQHRGRTVPPIRSGGLHDGRKRERYCLYCGAGRREYIECEDVHCQLSEPDEDVPPVRVEDLPPADKEKPQ